MTYFGPAWDSVICSEGSPSATPLGDICPLCEEAIIEGDRGWWIGTFDEVGEDELKGRLAPTHRECMLRSTIGGIEHLLAPAHPVGSCYEHSTLSYRQSAILAWAYIAKHGAPA